MDPYQNKPRSPKYRRSNTALFSLVLLGSGIVFFTIILIACSFVINYAGDFETSGGTGIEAKVQSEFNYTQYWAGVPFVITGVLLIFSGCFQRARGLTITSVIFCLLSVFITLFVISLDGSNWHDWNSQHRLKTYWDAQSGVECTSSTNTCLCKDNTTVKKSFAYECDEISELSSLYGATVGSAIIVAFCCTLSVLVITKSLSWKRIRYPQRPQYNDEFYMEPNGRRTPSVIDLPYTKRAEGEYVERPTPASASLPRTGPPFKQTVYRSYPY